MAEAFLEPSAGDETSCLHLGLFSLTWKSSLHLIFKDKLTLQKHHILKKNPLSASVPVSESSLSEELDSLLLPDSDEEPFVFAPLIASMDFSGAEINGKKYSQ